MNRLSVLVVEDHPDTREMLIDLLTDCGYGSYGGQRRRDSMATV